VETPYVCKGENHRIKRQKDYQLAKSMSSTHLYETLGLTPNVDKEEIKEAYLRLVHEYHANADHSPASEQHFRAVCEAYITLSKEGAIVLYTPVKPEPKESSFWQKRYSPAFILGTAAIGVTGALLGYYIQPKSTIVREIIRETPSIASVANQTEKKLESQPIVPNQQKSSTPSIQFAKLPEMPPQRAIATHSLLPQAISNRLPALPAIPKSVKIVRILPAPTSLVVESFMQQGPKIVPQKKLMALPLFSPRAIPAAPSLSSNTLLSRPIHRSVTLPPPPNFISSSTFHPIPVAVEEHESDEKLLAKLNSYDRDKATPSKDEDARILSDLNSLSR
jgi:DnaJ domain